MGSNWTERYLDHYSRYLGEPSQIIPYSVSEDVPTIRILVYDDVIAGCKVFASLGLCEFVGDKGDIAEVICPIDQGWDEVPSILAYALFRLVAERPFHPVRGVAVNGVDETTPDFVKKYKKSALYLTDPFGLDDDFPFVIGEENQEARVYLAMFLTKKEFDFLKKTDCEQLEDKFEEKGVDPYDIRRKSCV